MERRATDSAEDKDEIMSYNSKLRDYYSNEKRIREIFNIALKNTISLLESEKLNKYPEGMRKNWIRRLRTIKLTILPIYSNAYAETTRNTENEPRITFYVDTFNKSYDDLYHISLHEIAHVISFGNEHNELWKEIYKDIGSRRPATSYFVEASGGI